MIETERLILRPYREPHPDGSKPGEYMIGRYVDVLQALTLAGGLTPFADEGEALALANDTEFGLAAGVWTRDINRAYRAMRDIRTAIVYVNAGTIGSEVQLPFGGMRQTGNGHREAGQAALDSFSEWKTIYVDYSGRLQKAQIDPHADPEGA